MSPYAQTTDELARVFESNRKSVLKYILRRVRDYDDAEDIYQETVQRVLRHASNGIEITGCGILFLVAYQRVIKYFESKRRRSAEWLSEGLEGIVFEKNRSNTGLDWEIRDRIKNSLRLLRRDDANVLRLYYFEGLPIREIAHIFHVDYGVAKMRLVRARKKLGRIPEIASLANY